MWPVQITSRALAQKPHKFSSDGIMVLSEKWQRVIERNGAYLVYYRYFAIYNTINIFVLYIVLCKTIGLIWTSKGSILFRQSNICSSIVEVRSQFFRQDSSEAELMFLLHLHKMCFYIAIIISIRDEFWLIFRVSSPYELEELK